MRLRAIRYWPKADMVVTENECGLIWAPSKPDLQRETVLKIYGAAHSRAFRVIWLANEINIPCAQCKEPWFLALNPNGRLPVIDDDGFVMWESAAINLCKQIGIHQICDGHHILFVKSALSVRHRDGGCYAKSTLPSRYGYTSPRCHGRSCGRLSKDISRQKPLLCRRACQWGRDSYSCEYEKLSDRAVAAVIYRPNV